MKYDRRSIMKTAWGIRRESGCTMSAALKKAWAVAKEGKMEELKIEMIGSEKQVAWAQDILRKHHDDIVDTANRYSRRHEHALEKGDSVRAEEAAKKAEGYRAAASLFVKCCNANESVLKSAKFVIDHKRFALSAMITMCEYAAMNTFDANNENCSESLIVAKQFFNLESIGF